MTTRRQFLKSAAGAAMAVPVLDSLRPRGLAGDLDRADPRRRLVAVNVDLGFLPDEFFPAGTGPDYEPSRYLRELAPHRGDLTVFSGLSHPGVDGGHQSDVCFLTGTPHPRSAGFKNGISLDQFAARSVGHRTRLPTLALRVGPGASSLSYSGDGVRLPAENVPSRVYETLFVRGTPAQRAEQVRMLREGRSLMDAHAESLGRLRRTAGGADADRLEQYFQSVREVEKRLAAGEAWAETPKPDPGVPAPKDDLDPGKLVTRTRAMFDLARLALETDSTRLITIVVTQQFNPKVDLPGVELPHHALTHQSQRPDSRRQLVSVEAAQMADLNRLLTGLKTAAEPGPGGGTLLDKTMVLQGSNLGHAGRHDTKNLPVLLAGGGFRHGSHLAFDRDDNTPLARVFVSMLQRLGVETDRFATGVGTLPGLEAV